MIHDIYALITDFLQVIQIHLYLNLTRFLTVSSLSLVDFNVAWFLQSAYLSQRIRLYLLSFFNIVCANVQIMSCLCYLRVQ